MEHHLSLTPRLMLVGVGCFLSLLVLVFLLGFELGRQPTVPDLHVSARALNAAKLETAGRLLAPSAQPAAPAPPAPTVPNH